MNYFSNLLDSKLLAPVAIKLTPIIGNGVPHAKFRINEIAQFDGPLSSEFVYDAQLSLLSPISIELEMTNKAYCSEKETAIIVSSISVDSIEIIPKFQHCANYVNEKKFSSSTHYLGANGIWSFKIDMPFYIWLHHHTDQGWLLAP